METELKQKWLKALRSGRYKQTREYLHDDNGYCCLGVLASCSRLGKWHHSGSSYDFVPFQKNQDKFRDNIYDGDFLDDCKIFGLTKDQQSKLVTMNDEKGNNFKEIADWIEREL